MKSETNDIYEMLDTLALPAAAQRFAQLSESPELGSYTALQLLRAFCGAERTPMRFRADAMRNITDAPKRSIKLLNFSAGSLLCNASSPA